MAAPFELKCDRKRRSWRILADLDKSMLEEWDNLFTSSGINPALPVLPLYYTPEKIQEFVREQKQLISIVKDELDAISPHLVKPYAFTLVNPEGIVVYINGPDQIIHTLRERNIGLGTCFALEKTGINAISVSMELKDCVIIKGREHHLQMFSKSICICTSIHFGNEIYGYLNLTICEGEDETLAVPLLEQIICKVQDKMTKLNPEIREKYIFNLLDQYGLSKREKEIGYSWMQNQSTLQISSSLGISEGTVRNILKKVYLKTKVCDKGQFIKKFLI